MPSPSTKPETATRHSPEPRVHEEHEEQAAGDRERAAEQRRRPVVDPQVDLRRQRGGDRPADDHRAHRETREHRAVAQHPLRVRRHVRRLADQHRADREARRGSPRSGSAAGRSTAARSARRPSARSSTNTARNAAAPTKSSTLGTDSHAQCTPPSSSAEDQHRDRDREDGRAALVDPMAPRLDPLVQVLLEEARPPRAPGEC